MNADGDEPDPGAEARRTCTARRARAVIEGVAPAVDGGRFAVKRVAGDAVEVEADCFTDGHDVLACAPALAARGRGRVARGADGGARQRPLARRRSGRRRIGRYRYTVTAWVDHFLSWRHDFARRVDPEDIRVAAQVGAELVEAAAARARAARTAAG